MTAEQDPASIQPPEPDHTSAKDHLPNRYDPAVAGLLANRLKGRDIGPGELAGLRRLNTDRPASPLFWHLMFRYRITDPENPRSDNLPVERAWAHLLSAVAHGTRAGEETTIPHNPAIPMGQALSEAGYHEARLQALITADTARVQRLAAQAAAFLHQKGNEYNCADLARLMLSPIRSKAQRDADRTYMARQYYRQTYRNSQEANRE